MTEFARIYDVSFDVLRDLRNGSLTLDEKCQRVRKVVDGQFHSVLRVVPGASLEPEAIPEVLQKLLRLTIPTIQLMSTTGAIASVANIAVSCVGFALVLRRLSRIEGKLDELLTNLPALKESVAKIHAHQDALSLSKLQAASHSLELALAASSVTTRNELAVRARNLFQESRLLYGELWRQSDPWYRNDIEVRTALEMHGRYVACAIGELQANFLVGDLGVFRHAVRTIANSLEQNFAIDVRWALRSRSDMACQAGIINLTRFNMQMPTLSKALSEAFEIHTWTTARILDFMDDALLVEEWGIEPVELMRAVQQCTEARIYVLAPVPLKQAESAQRPASAGVAPSGRQERTSLPVSPQPAARMHEQPIKTLIADPSELARSAQQMRKEWLIGRGDESYFAIPDRSVSNCHARLLRENDQFFIEDLGSTNGTWIRGVRVPVGARVRVERGEHILLGCVSFKIPNL